MWNSRDDEVNEYGEAVRLYLPAKSGPRRTNTDLLDSHIGGMAYDREAPICSACQDTMNLLVQLRLPNTTSFDGSKVDRMVYVFACARASCFENVQFVNGFASVRDHGVLSCQTVESPVLAVKQPAVPIAPTKSSWYADDGDDDDDDDNEWGTSATNGDDGAENLAGLEKAVSAMEQNLQDGALPKQLRKSNTKATPSLDHADESSKKTFPCFLLTKQIEPPAPNPGREEDDVGLSASDEKVRNMLAKYLAEEDDEDILAALKGTGIGAGTGSGEEDERLTEKERLLLGFQDRLRRVPRQVVRYAKGGSPFWSIPSDKNGERLWKKPECSACGTPCEFEMQLLPSLLDVLKIDQFSGGVENTAQEADAVEIGDLLANGMNWGSVAVFTCPNMSCTTHEGALVIQASVDETPAHAPDGRDRVLAPSMAVVEDMDDDADFEPYISS